MIGHEEKESKMNYRYEFIYNEFNLDRLKSAGFEDIPGIRDYYYNKVEVMGSKVDIHTIYINKQTNLLTYRFNDKDYESFNLFEIHEMIARKIKNLIDTKLIVPTSRKETKERYRK